MASLKIKVNFGLKQKVAVVALFCFRYFSYLQLCMAALTSGLNVCIFVSILC